MHGFSLTKPSRMHVGIDFTEAPPRMVGVVRGTVRVETNAPRPPPELARVLASGEVCTACTQPDTSLVVPLSPPSLPAGKLRKILPALLDVQIPFPLSECAAVFTTCEAACLAHAIRKSDLEKQIHMHEDAGCNPGRMVPAAHAAWMLALAEHPPGSPSEARAVFIAGPRQTTLLTGHGHVLERQSVFRTNAHEPLRRLRLAFGGMPDPLTCIVAGSAHAQLPPALSTPAGRPAPAVSTAASPAFFLARALAFDGRNAGTRNDTNFRRSACPHPADLRRNRRPAVFLAAMLFLCAVTLTAASLTAVKNARQAEARTRRALQERLDTLAGYPIRTRGTRALEDARAALPLNMDTAVVLHHENPLPKRLSAIARHGEAHGITLHHLSLDADGLTASGVGQTAENITAFVTSLRQTGVATQLTEPPKAADGGGFTFFTLPPQP